MIRLKNKEQIRMMEEGGKILRKILLILKKSTKKELRASELNFIAEQLISKFGAVPSFKDYLPKGSASRAFPSSLCVSINEEIVHGIPFDKKIIKEGGIVSLDLGIKYKGFYVDSAITFSVGRISNEAKRLINTAQKALFAGISKVKPRAFLGDVSSEIERIILNNKMSVVKDLAGHGVGFEIHEEPSVPNFGKAGKGILLEEGMTLAIEPMVSLGDGRIRVKDDGWTIETFDKSLSAHFEHTVAVTAKGCKILT